jgi:arsenite oxidase large subunit
VAASGIHHANTLVRGLRSQPGEVLQGPAIEGARGKEPVQKDVPTQTGAPAPAAAGTERIVGTKRLYADGKFNKPDGKATFMETKWRGLQAPGKEAEKNKWPYLINNGRTNIVWQNAYLDQDNEFVMDRFPYPFIQMNPQDMAELNVKQGDLVEVYNDNGSTQAVVYPTPTAKRKQTFMLFAYPTGVQGNVVSPGVNEFIIPNYKQTWGGIRKIADAPEAVRHLTFKSEEYPARS